MRLLTTGWLVAGRMLAALEDRVLGGMNVSFRLASGAGEIPIDEVITPADEAKRQGGMRAAEWTTKTHVGIPAAT